MNPTMIEWFYDHFMPGFSGRLNPGDPEHKEVLAEYAEAGEAFFAAFTAQQRNLYFRFDKTCKKSSCCGKRRCGF